MKIIRHILTKKAFKRNLIHLCYEIIYLLLVFVPLFLVYAKYNNNEFQTFIIQYLFILYIIEIISIKNKSINTFVADLKTRSLPFILKPLNISLYIFANRLDIKNIILILAISIVLFISNPTYLLTLVYVYLIIDVGCKVLFMASIFTNTYILNIITIIKSIVNIYRIPLSYYEAVGFFGISFFKDMGMFVYLNSSFYKENVSLNCVYLIITSIILDMIINRLVLLLHHKD